DRRRLLPLQPYPPLSLLRVAGTGRGVFSLPRLDRALPVVEWGRTLATSAGPDPRDAYREGDETSPAREGTATATSAASPVRESEREGTAMAARPRR
ncbi:unnamed protein product, partial [Urochloa humidicola]